MRVAVTGTPGTGKTTATERLDADLEVVHLNDVVREEGLHAGRDEERDSLVADVDALRERFDGDGLLLESHLAHLLPADRVVVLRCHPGELARRLRERDESAASVEENAESEALDLVLSEAVQRHGEERVYEIDTTDRTPDEVAAAMATVLDGERAPSAGDVDFTEYL